MAQKEFQAWVDQGSNPLRQPSLGVYLGKIEEIPYDEIGPILYSVAKNGDKTYFLIIGHRLSEWRPDGRAKVCTIETIDDEDKQVEADVFVSVYLHQQGTFADLDTVFHK